MASNPSDGDIQKIHMLANTVVLRHAQSTQWSTYHLRKTVSSLEATTPQAQVSEYKQKMQSAPRYVTCVDAAYACVCDLRNALLAEPALAHYADNVKLYASRHRDKITGVEDLPEHCIAALPVGTYIIIMDVGYSPTAVLLKTGQIQALRPSITFADDISTVKYRYFCMSKPPYRSVLTYCTGSSKKAQKSFTMYDISYDDAILQINFTLAREIDRENKGNDAQLPYQKFIVSDVFLEEKPVDLPYAESSSGYYTSMCKLAIAFEYGNVSVMIPKKDWLLEYENTSYVAKLQELGIQTKNYKNMCILLAQNKGSIEDKERLELVAEIVEILGIAESDFLQAVDDVSNKSVSKLGRGKGNVTSNQ